MKFKEDALILLKNNLEDSDLEATNLSLEGKMKCNFVKKSHLEAFGKIIDVMSKELKWNDNMVITVVETKTEIQDEHTEKLTEEQ